MKSNYKILGDFIQEVNLRNDDLHDIRLLGVSIQKVLMPSIANTIGTDMTTYKLIKRGQFAYGPVTSRNGDKISVALLSDFDNALISQAYTCFEINDTNTLLPEYLMMWFRRPEFDRYARFMSHGSAREVFSWEDMCMVQIPVPSIDKQREIVDEYHTIADRIVLNNRFVQKLEEISQAIFKEWFINYEFPNSNGEPYKSSGGEMVYDEQSGSEIPKGWKVGTLGECVDFINGYGFESDDLLDFENDDCYGVFKMGNIKRGGGLNLSGTKSWIERDKCKSLDRFVLKKGDLLMAMTDMKDNIGILGNTALMTVDDKFIVNQRVGVLRVNNEYGVSCRYLYLLTNSINFLQNLRSRANRGVQVNLTTNEILSSTVIIADHDTNIRFDNLLNSIFNKINLCEKNTECAEKMLSLILSKLSTIGEQ